MQFWCPDGHEYSWPEGQRNCIYSPFKHIIFSLLLLELPQVHGQLSWSFFMSVSLSRSACAPGPYLSQVRLEALDSNFRCFLGVLIVFILKEFNEIIFN